MSEKPDQLRLLKTKYLSRITEIERELARLKEKVRVIGELQEDAQDLSPATSNNLKYSGPNVRLTEACLDAIKTIGANGGVTAAQVGKYLKENGFQHAGKNYLVSVGIALNRLSEGLDDRRIDKVKTGGRRLYKTKI